MILLVVGLVAVIVVILIAVFLSIRLGRGDEHDDEPDIRSRSRDQRAEEDRWREPGSRDTHRSPEPTREAGRGTGERRSGTDDDRRRSRQPAYSGARERTPARRASDRDYEEEPRRPARRDSPEYESSPARRPAAAVSAGSRGRHDEALSRQAAVDDFPAAGYPSMDFVPDEYVAAGYPSQESREYAVDDFPSEEFAAVPPRSAKRPDSRRKEAPAPASGKGRTRQHRGKRDDADDWPSSEWDKLSDEQYWAELSADKPLASMARPAQPVDNATAAAAELAAAKPSHDKRDTRAARALAAAAESTEELPRTGPAGSRPHGQAAQEREQGPGRRERPRHEPTTERLPVRPRQQFPEPAARHSIPAGTHPSLDTGRYPVRETGRHPSLDTGFPATFDTGPHPSLDTGFPATFDTGPHPSLDTGFPATFDTGRHPSLDTGPRPARDPSLAMLGGLTDAPPPPVPGALEDDPLTSPTFSLKADPATDSRSYGHARRASQAATSNDPSGSLAGDPLASTGAGHAVSGSYPAADYASPAYDYPPVPTPAQAAPAVPAEWYSAPPADPAATPPYGNPYRYQEASTAGPPASPAADPGYSGYLADPLRVYSPPPYESPVSTGYPDPYPAVPAVGGADPAMGPGGGPVYPGAYPQHPYGHEHGQLEPPPDPGAPDGTGYTPGYDGSYGSDPYAAGGYSPYPPQG
jgi:hypothetical protein